jgi:ubiquinone/menaquinone biosynthesis C-methylase UbiE
VIYQHPLAYLLGLEGLALLRGWAGDFDREFVLERLAEVRRLLDEPALADHPGVDVARRDTQAGYRDWAPTYDDRDNGLFGLDEPVVDSILDALPVGDALDAACGTGRFAVRLASRGHRVVGVDSSPEMLEVARAKVPGADFHLGELDDLPLPDASVDLVVCGLALAHVPDLAPPMAELARVVRPGGHVVITDAHHELVFRGSIVKALGPNGEPGLVATYRHTPGDFLRAALAVGLEVRACEEPGLSSRDSRSQAPPPPAEITVGAPEDWPWTLLPLVPAATQAAWWTPGVIVWHFERRR